MKSHPSRMAPILFFAGIAMIWLLGIVPGILRSSELPGLIAQTQKQIQTRRQARGQARQDSRQTRLLQQQFGILLTVPTEAEHSEHMIREAHRVCNESGVRLITLQPQSPTVRAEFKRFPVQLNLEGDLKGLKTLLLKLRDSRPLIDPERVSFRSTGEPKKINAQLAVASFAWAPKTKGKAKSR